MRLYKSGSVLLIACLALSPKIIFAQNQTAQNQTNTDGARGKLLQESGKNRPQIALESTSLDLGRMSKKRGTIRRTIKIINKGNTDLIISNIRASCSCTAAVLTVGKVKSPSFTSKGAEAGWQMVIGPNKKGSLEIRLDLTQFTVSRAKISRDVYITSNDPLNTITKVSMKGELIP